MKQFHHKPDSRIASLVARLAYAAILLVTISLFAAPRARADDQRAIEITPDVTTQSALNTLLAVTDKNTLNRQIDQLVSAPHGETARLVPQLLLFGSARQDDARARALGGRVLARLEGPKDSIVAALAPHLDNRDAAVQSMTRNLLTGYEDRSPTRPPDFAPYRALIEADVRAGKEPQTSLVRFMYESDPGVALQTMVRASQLRDPAEIKPILWGEHRVAELLWKRRYGFVARDAIDADAMQQLDLLSRHARWWVRLYVAQIAQSHPELATPELVRRLKNDTDARVRAVLH